MNGRHLAWLASRERFGMKLGLDAMRALLARLGDPHLDLPAILVAGTNGKGSTAAMTAALLTAAGHRTLLYTSPHVASVGERIRIDGRCIRRDVLERRLGEVRAAVRGMGERPTYFEVMTAAALLHARACRATAGVFEIGLGGRYDATNVIPAGVGVITGIDRDHTEHLGTGLRRIAWNKAGIIKAGQVVLTLESRRELLGVFRDECRRRRARLLRVPQGSARRSRQGAAIWDLDLAVPRRLPGGGGLPAWLRGVRLGLRGPRQGAQAVLALGAALALPARTPAPLTGRAVRRALAGVHLPGRYEQRRLGRRRLLIADAAHNPAAAEVLAGEVRPVVGRRPVTLLFGAVAEKDVPAMLRPLLTFVDSVNLSPIENRRGLKKKDLLDLVRSLGTAGARSRAGAPRVHPDSAAAWSAALAATPPGGILLVTGSFYLLGELWPRIRRLPVVS